MLNQSSEHALRALLYMARGGTGAYKATTIARVLGLPSTYLSKVLHQLVHAGLLRSVRGRSGGYSLARDPSDVHLSEIAEPFQQLAPRGHCLMGNWRCDPARACAAHERWRAINDVVSSQLNDTSLADMLTPPRTAGAAPGAVMGEAVRR